MCYVKFLSVVLLCLSLIGCGEKKRALESAEICGMIKGVVMINPSPYSITEVYGSTFEGSPYVRVQLIGESNTIEYLVGADFGPIGGGVYRTSLSMGGYDCNRSAPPALQGVKAGEYVILFADGYFDAAQGRIPLERLLISRVNNAPIEVKAGKTTDIGLVLLTPP